MTLTVQVKVSAMNNPNMISDERSSGSKADLDGAIPASCSSMFTTSSHRGR
jgi:hypothetical protein